MPAKEVRLKRLLRDPDIATVVEVVGEGRTAVLGRKGRRLVGPDVDAPRVPVVPPGGPELGSVAGPRAEQVAAVLVALVGRERARRELADEVLDMYREVNLLYALGRVLAHAHDRADLARRALDEATRHVTVEDAAVVYALETGRPVVAASVGAGSTRIPEDLSRLRIVAGPGDEILVAPLALRTRQRGAIVLHRVGREFSAGDLKLTGAVAAQCASVLERVLDEEQRAQEAAEREDRLRRQVAELQIRLDHEHQAAQVGRITETEYFGGLRAQAADLRRIITDRGGRAAPTGRDDPLVPPVPPDPPG